MPTLHCLIPQLLLIARWGVFKEHELDPCVCIVLLSVCKSMSHAPLVMDKPFMQRKISTVNIPDFRIPQLHPICGRGEKVFGPALPPTRLEFQSSAGRQVAIYRP